MQHLGTTSRLFLYKSRLFIKMTPKLNLLQASGIALGVTSMYLLWLIWSARQPGALCDFSLERAAVTTFRSSDPGLLCFLAAADAGVAACESKAERRDLVRGDCFDAMDGAEELGFPD
jgi:hypothetical protein